MINQRRTRLLNGKKYKSGQVIYWMSRDQRAEDNWALLFAQELAVKSKQPLRVLFCLVPEFLGATARQYGFMLKGLRETEKDLALRNIPLIVRAGEPGKIVPEFFAEHNAGVLVSDFDPLKIKRRWKKQVNSRMHVPFYEVDAHNIVPAWLTSDKQEYGAYTIRPKIRKMLPEFLEEFPALIKHKHNPPLREVNDWKKIEAAIKVDCGVKEVSRVTPGAKAAKKQLSVFLKHKLGQYAQKRNFPEYDAASGLSPYLHFGQISAQRVALETQKAECGRESRNAFLEELIVRRELADNYCLYNRNYDRFSGFPEWAKQSLKEHAADRREYLYSLRRMENASTHDELWNAAQTEMVGTGRMHGYMRMYWGKKILEWSPTPQQAQKRAIYLNDKYELDGRDPNGYVGISWAIGGVHDRAWPRRPVFGKIRYMNYNGCKSKFDIKNYIAQVQTG